MIERERTGAMSEPFAGDEAFSEELKAVFDGEVSRWAPSPSADSQIAAAAHTARDLSDLQRLGGATDSGEPRRRRYLAVLTSAVAIFAIMAGVGIAANGAAPGDPLFALDLALEEVGIGDGETAERMDEVTSLAESGDLVASLDHAAVTVATLPDATLAAEAEEALFAASTRISDGAVASSRVSRLLGQLASSARAGDTGAVAEFAIEIRASVDSSS